jgi:hypothetical protein
VRQDHRAGGEREGDERAAPRSRRHAQLRRLPITGLARAADPGQGERRQEERRVLPERLGRRAFDQVAEAAAGGVRRQRAVREAPVAAAGEEQEEADEQRRRHEHPKAAHAEHQQRAQTDLDGDAAERQVAALRPRSSPSARICSANALGSIDLA